MKIRIKFFLVFFMLSVSLLAQDRLKSIESRLKDLSEREAPGLNQKIDISVNGVSLQEFVRGIAISNALNVSIDPAISVKVVNNFSNVSVANVFLFLCEKYSLDINFVGPIMSFVPYIEPAPLQVKYSSKKINISYDKNTDLITLDLTNDSIASVAKTLTKVTGKNVVFTPDINGKMLSGYIQSMVFSNAMDKLALTNDLKVSYTKDDFYVFEKKEAANANAKTDNKTALVNYNSPSQIQGLTYKVDIPSGLISVDASNVPIANIIAAVSGELKTSFFLFSDLKGNATLSIKDFNYDDFLTYLLNGSEFTYKKQNEVYLLGDRSIEGLRTSKLVQLQYRTVENVMEIIPDELKKGINIKKFNDLNGLILSGSQPSINELENFLRQVDRIVPNVAIEVIIADVRNTKTVSTGIQAGLGTAPTKTSGTLYPDFDMSLGAKAINSLISGINGLGVINLGKVTPNFYLKLKALETQGILKLRSTPQIATINGKEAKLNIGKTEYYLEITNNIVGTQIPQTAVTQSYKPVNADMAITIQPFVSGDDQITLDIEVKQSNFTERISPTAPPGTISRNFKSSIRVKNGEMIMLGGLEENSVNNSGTGVPLLSRIPVLRWLFSSRTKARSDNKLTIFIKPTVLY